MSSYKIYAKQGNKTMPIKIEEKHTYGHLTTVNTEGGIVVGKQDSLVAQDSGNPNGYGVNNANIKILHNSNNIRIVQGTAEDQRIGNKVNIKSVAITMYIHPNTQTFINNYYDVQRVMCPFRFNFRIMTVKFEQQMTTTDIATWYRQTYIYLRSVSITNSTQFPYQSNWMDKLRESTPWTGQFEILLDKKFQLTDLHSQTQMNITVPITGQVNFDNTSNNPTANQYVSNIYTFLISPANNDLDMDMLSCDQTNTITPSATMWNYQGNIKVIYYDV